MATPTPHIGAKHGEIAETVIMAGDPLRAKFMAETFIESPQLVTDVRVILRVGSAGSMHPDLHVGDQVLAMGACTDSNYGAQYELPGTFAPIADFGLLGRADVFCDSHDFLYKVGNVLSSDVFYSDNPHNDRWMKMKVFAVEMEAAALYMNAARAGRRALVICTISDHLLTGEVTTAQERVTTFTNMMEVALSLID